MKKKVRVFSFFLSFLSKLPLPWLGTVHDSRSDQPRMEKRVVPSLVETHLHPTLVENMIKKNRNRLSIAVLLTILICSH
jgi:hypothetical protein